MQPVVSRPRLLFSRILVAVDTSPAAERTARLAISFARDRDAELAFVHALDVNRVLVHADRSFDDFPHALDVAREAAREVLERCSALAADAGVFARSYVRDGTPVDEVAWLASALRADLVVIGNRPGSRLRRLLYGSTRDDLIRASTVPVLVAEGDSLRPL
jgi:nucleotide-binding universal stress UspA family protein